jgi:hypothetical protein
MKIIFVTLFTFTFCSVYSQDSPKIKEIDSIVYRINTSDLPRQRDTLIQDHPQMGIKTTTYLTTIIKDRELYKFVNFVSSTITENAGARQMTGSNSFYYDHNMLIKVEEYIIEGDKKGEASWYYSEDKPIYYTLKTDKAEDRANLLLTMAKAMLKQMIK